MPKNIKEDSTMGFLINHNVQSMQSLGQLDITTNSIGKSLSKLSSGLRIVTAGDDPSGLIISERLRAQQGSLETAKLNAQEGQSMIATAEGTLNEVNSILQRMRSLAVRATQDVTLGSSELAAMDSEQADLALEITRIAGYAQYNGKTLFDGNLSGVLHVGPNNVSSVDEVTLAVGSMDATALGVDALDYTSNTTASQALTSLDAAITAVSNARSDLGIIANRLDHTITNLGIMSENTTAAESRIRDVDMAKEISNFTRLQILQQSNVAMIGQANSQPQSVLSLLK